ncbi:unnamed protein product [Clonostachys byssicola]|uniref:Uncharacterized protein n=1 Tax=Clonostachys byssicola TaxID=160290 RepID=A0A9N9Y162_9HYPO|nr:unnamed protein product [Clonostachys byssicola]
MSDPASCSERQASPPISGTYLKLRRSPSPPVVNGVPLHVQRAYDQFFAQKSLPFRDDEPLIGDPDCSWKSVQKHMLRACPFKLEDMIFEERLGDGIDGVVFKVSIDGTPYALKVGSAPTMPSKKNAGTALLQMIGASIAQSEGPIYLKPEIESRKDALYNTQAFCNEARQKPRFNKLPGAVPITSFPRFRKRFGWLKANSTRLFEDGRMGPPCARVGRDRRAMTKDGEYYAILYEYISPGEQHVDMEGLQAQMDLLYLVGFDICDLKPENWIRGILIDMAALESPWEMHWSHRAHKHYDVNRISFLSQGV